jgi:hypothetical protein
MHPQSTKVPRACQHCGTTFAAYPANVRRGWAKYCSRACQTTAQQVRETRSCVECGEPFTRPMNQLRASGGRFCSRRCATVAGHRTQTQQAGETLADRLWRYVRKTETCWLWTGGTYSYGYGRLWFDGQEHAAHHVAWELLRGPVPETLWVLHNCPGGDNPRCVNPDHLWLGNAAANNADRQRKGPTPLADNKRRSRARRALR